MAARRPQAAGTKTQSAVATGRQAIRVGGTKTQSAVAIGSQAIQGCKHQPAVAIRVGGTKTQSAVAIGSHGRMDGRNPRQPRQQSMAEICPSRSGAKQTPSTRRESRYLGPPQDPCSPQTHICTRNSKRSFLRKPKRQHTQEDNRTTHVEPLLPHKPHVTLVARQKLHSAGRRRK